MLRTMLSFFGFFCCIVVLFFLSRQIKKRTVQLLQVHIRHVGVLVFFLSAMFFVGTLIHEIAHFAMAVLLRVRVASFTLLPRRVEDHVVLGSVNIVKTDFFRKTLIGLSPLFVGIAILFLCIWFTSEAWPLDFWLLVLVGYVVFQTSNTMFPSRKDMEGTWITYILLAFLLGVIAWLGIDVAGLLSPQVQSYFNTGLLYLVPVVLLDFCILSILLLIQKR